MDRYIVEKVEEARIKPEWKEQHKGEWVVYEPYPTHPLIYGYFDTEEKAKRHAELLNKADKVIEDIEACAEDRISELTQEEIEFLREYTGGTITIEV